MRIQAYLRVVSDEATIRSLHSDANLPGATIQRSKNGQVGTANDMWWTWQTALVDLDLHDVDRGVKGLLVQCQSLLSDVKKLERPEIDVILEVVTHYKENEGGPGMYLSAESILLLSELGGALDHDVVPDLT